MARKRKGDRIHGWFILDKPAGISSSAAVGTVRRLLNVEKLGHGGTLDPLASGILPLALGEATKTVSYIMAETKQYRFAVRWGEARSTDDAEGEVIQTSPVRPDEAAIQGILPRFIGDIQQTPPIFSAIKVDGKRAYALARADQAVELTPRFIRIDALTLLSMTPDEAILEVTCGKGTYVRSLARDLAKALGTCGYVSSLRRTAVGRFDESAAISLDSLMSLGHNPAAFKRVLPLLTVLDDIPALAVTEAEAKLIRTGRSVPLGEGRDLVVCRPEAGGIVCAAWDDQAVALGRIQDAEFCPVRVFNL